MNLTEKTYQILKQRIITCEYLPSTMLNERELIEELNISRTPFREAINTLAHEGWVTPIPHKGILVSDITLKDVLDLYSIREQLEPFAVNLAMENIPRDVLETYYHSLKETAEPTSNIEVEAVQKDEDLHKMILTYANNQLLTRMMDEIYDHNHRIRILSMQKGSVVVQLTQKQHFKIIEAMYNNDLDAATREMHNHIISSKNRALATIVKQNSGFKINFNNNQTESYSNNN